MALVLVAVGMLGVAGSAALLVRGSVAQAGILRAVHRAAFRSVNVSATTCTGPVDGELGDAALGMQERWHVGPRTGAAMMVDDSITWTDRGIRRTLVTRSAILCP
jgi:hypothetical protein